MERNRRAVEIEQKRGITADFIAHPDRNHHGPVVLPAKTWLVTRVKFVTARSEKRNHGRNRGGKRKKKKEEIDRARESKRGNGGGGESSDLDRCQLERVDDQHEFDSDSNWWWAVQVPTVPGTRVADRNAGK